MIFSDFDVLDGAKTFFLGEKKAFFLCFSFTDLNSTDAWDPCVSQVAAWHPSWDELAQLHAWEIDHQVPFRYMRRGSSQSWLVYIRASHFLSFGLVIGISKEEMECVKFSKS